jgi:pimeloyl-ACP methyl ester carboxylesterase
MPATTADEVPVFFRAGGDELFGIVTQPTVAPLGVGCLLLSGGGRNGAGGTPSPGVNRVWVRLARQLADLGFHAMRMDYRGIGESGGRRPEYDLSEPFVPDVLAAVEQLRNHGAGDVVLIGTCFGGRSALAAAPHLEGVRGVALFGSPVRDFKKGTRLASMPMSWYLRRAARPSTLRKAADPRNRKAYLQLALARVRRLVSRSGPVTKGTVPSAVSPAFMAHTTTLIERNVPLLFAFGEDDAFLEDFEVARRRGLGAILDRAGDGVEVRVLEGRVHGLTTTAGQELTMACAADWITGITGRAHAPLGQ